MNNITLKLKSGQASLEEIDAWKAKHGEIFAIVVEDKIGYLRKVDRKTLSFASTVGTKDPMKFNEIILTNCWLGGDEELKNNDDYFLAVSGTLSQLIVVKEAELVKL
ncbi:hypothetical protein MW871_15065 [Flavobacterium sp. I-SCBP12n]|uniref:Uncharacterized protein n=1 Tax=Flavobacterium pygoscelis TaxID=2893176 RepID=A0A9X1XTY1_9FLAO|nr:hypothetical protein [Flavobacterium pygoscelis]MCK8143209.1 hypothetical protein [Flavobacterium pygoscelis]